MNSKKIFPWSRRQSSSEAYYRTGGLLSIATPDSTHGFDVKVTPEIGQQRAPDLTIIPSNHKQLVLSPHPLPYNVVLSQAASSLQAAFNDMLRAPTPTRAPTPSAAACSRPMSIHKPLPGRPRSLSLSSIQDLPAELPGSILQENWGYPAHVTVDNFAPIRPVSQNSRRETPISASQSEDSGNQFHVLALTAEPQTYIEVLPELAHRRSEMRSVRSASALRTAAQPSPSPSPSKAPYQKTPPDGSSRRLSKPNLVASPLPTDTKLATCSTLTNSNKRNGNSTPGSGSGSRLSQPSPLIVEEQAWKKDTDQPEKGQGELGTTTASSTTGDKQIEELKGTITSQDQTISTLQAQFASLRTSHEAHISSLTSTHTAEVASLKNYARVLEEQIAQRPTLHHASSNNLLFLIDTTEPQTPKTESSEHTVESSSANSTKSFQSAAEKQQHPPRKSQNSSEMESLKRKLSSTRRPEPTSRNLLPELNQYKQNFVALQKQIESLMAKLNESKKNERALKASLEETEKKCYEWQQKADNVDKLANSTQALQNTIDHLESRLEIANTEKLDVAEQLYNLQAEKSPFDDKLSKLQVPSGVDSKDKYDAHLSFSTVFSSGSPISSANKCQDPSTLSAFVTRIERLQDQLRQKDACVSELEAGRNLLQHKYDQLEQEHTENSLQMDIQNELLQKTQKLDTHVEQLRTAVIDRESIIREKETAVRAVERQLDHHKLLLKAEIRKHATISLHANIEKDPLPDLNTVAAKAEVDRWIARLQERLNREKPTVYHEPHVDPREMQIGYLRQEIDFYIREIIFYKLDIKGYKSDIKKLRRLTAQLSSYGNRTSDLESDASSLRPTVTPNLGYDSPVTPELGVSDKFSTTASLFSMTSARGPITPPASLEATPTSPSLKTATKLKVNHAAYTRDLNTAAGPQTPTGNDSHGSYKAQNKISSVSSRFNIEAVSEWREPTPQLGDHNIDESHLSGLPQDSPLSLPSHKRSMSESIIQTLKTTKPSEQPTELGNEGSPAQYRNNKTERIRSASLSSPMKGRSTPERPPRPRYGLFDGTMNSSSTGIGRPVPLRVDVLTEAMQHRHESEGGTSSANIRNTASILNSDALEVATGPQVPNSVPIMLSRSGSGRSNKSTTGTIRPPERKLSNSSSSSIPFVIAMGSPHNPALISPTAKMPPTSCSITRNAPLKLNTATSRTGLGGTMASSIPVITSKSPNEISKQELPASKPTTKSSLTTSGSHARKFSFSKIQDEPGRLPGTPSHSRSVSSSSIRTVIRLPKTWEKEKDTQHVRKDSIGMPQPLDSPFDMGRSASARDAHRQKEAPETHFRGYSIGEAI